MNLFKKLRTRYFELWDYIDESQGAFINKKGKIVAIVDMCNPFTYSILSRIYSETNDIDLTKEDYYRLYPKRAKGLSFVSEKELALIPDDETSTLGYLLKKSMLQDFEKLYERLSEMGIHFLLKPINGPWLTEEDIESINTSLKDFYLTYQSLDKLLQAPHDFPKNEILSNEDIVKNLKRKSDCIFFEYEDFAKKAASNEYARKVYEANLRFEAICKKMGLIQSQY